MIVTEIYKGQGLGNQLWCYAVTRAIAVDRGLDFSIQRPENFKCNDFMRLDFGNPVRGGDGPGGGPPTTLPDGILHYYKERRLVHPENGDDISTHDDDLVNIPDNTKIDGNMQDEQYIIRHRDAIRQWLKVKKEYECFDYADDNICVINFRGGEYTQIPRVFLPQSYWDYAVANMRRVNPNFHFVVITDDEKTAKKYFPKFEVYHYGIAKDYVIIKNAKFLILSNSSFAWFPAWLNENLKLCIAPKYWWGHNSSDGYWACGYNITSGWEYQDRVGLLHDYRSCLQELNNYVMGHQSYYIMNKQDNQPIVRDTVVHGESSANNPANAVLKLLKRCLPTLIQQVLWKIVHIKRFLPHRGPRINPKTPIEERRIFNALKDNFRVVFDVGARNELSFYHMKPDCEFHLFEPNDRFVNELSIQVDRLPHHSIIINAFGLSDKNADNLIYYEKSQSFIINRVFAGIEVDTGKRFSVRSLDSYVAEHNISHIDFLKIDAEGSDYKIILGGQNSLRANKVSFVQFEFGNWGGFRNMIDALSNFYLYLMMEPVLLRAIEKIIWPTMDAEEKKINFHQPVVRLDETLINLIDRKIIPTGNGGNVLGIHKSVPSSETAKINFDL